MNTKNKQIFRIIFAALFIAGTIYLSLRYLFKGPGFMKVLILVLIVAVIYLAVNYVIKKSNQENGK